MKFKKGDQVRYVRTNSCVIKAGAIGIVIHTNKWGAYKVQFSHQMWWCAEHNLRNVFVKGQQLMFNFMY